LVSKGIQEARLTAKGYGKTQPVADNKNEEGRSLNRRTEFKIIKN
jgi:outer membrane protein OmpA-like peptidoglycan-associated protein